MTDKIDDMTEQTKPEQTSEDRRSAKAAELSKLKSLSGSDNSTDSELRPRRPAKRILVPKKTNQVDNVVVVPTLNSLMNDAMSIIGSELARYRSKTSKGVSLDLKEARVIANYMDTLTRASKEAREQARAEDLADLTNEELLQLAAQIAAAGPAVDPATLTDDDED